jgi:uncharacterized repeat protein (TIGR03803 family)
MRGNRQVLTAAILAAGVALGGAAQAKFKVLHSFCALGEHHSCNDGSNPQSGLVMDAAGNLFGTTAQGGKDYGTAFELERKPKGGFNFKTIYRFCSFCGHSPNGPLIVDTAGNLYGTAGSLVFELSPVVGQKQWSEKVLYRFCSQQNCTDGNAPFGGLTYAGASSGSPYDGVSPIYGATIAGGANNAGTVFDLTNNSGIWTEAVLYSFCAVGGDQCLDGSDPAGGVILDQAGNLYGTTDTGGGHNDGGISGGAGTVFELSPSGQSWIETVLYAFCSTDQCTDGAFPTGNLTMDVAGNLLGITGAGGQRCKPDPAGCGVVFKLLPNGASSEETVLYAFCQKSDCRDGREPLGGVVLDESGDLFGTTSLGGGNDIDRDGLGGGIAYELSGSSFKVLHAFCTLANCADGEYPERGSLVSDGQGHFLGTVGLGGQFGEGAVFELRLR